MTTHLMGHRRSIAEFAGILILAGSCGYAHAVTTYTWPNLGGSGACTSTLQDCIDGATAGDVVVVGSDDAVTQDGITLVEESISIDKSLSLIGAPGIDAIFTPGHSIRVSSPTVGAIDIALDHLVLHHGHVTIEHNSDTASSYTLTRLRIDEVDGTGPTAAISMTDQGGGRPHFIVGDAVIRTIAGATSRVGAIQVHGNGGAWDVDVFRNHITGSTALLTAISINGTSAGGVHVSDNTIDGVGYSLGIRFGQNPGSAANTLDVLDNAVTGARGLPTGEPAIAVFMTNTSLRLVNNTVVGCTHGLFVGHFGTDSSSGRVANNLVAFNASSGLEIADDLASVVSNGYNLVYANDYDHFTAGPGTLTVDPLLAGPGNPRASSLASPLVDAGNLDDVPPVPFGRGFDADGEDRVLFNVDIGAYELSLDRSGIHSSTVANSVDDYTRLDEPAWNLAGGAVLLVTPLKAPAASLESANSLGVFQDATSLSPWSIYHENVAALSPGRQFSVFAPLESRTHYVHHSTSANSTANYTMLDSPELNGQRGAIAFVTHNWNPDGGPGTYHDHRIGLEYFGTHWYIRNEDLADMAVGVSFNVVIADPFTSLGSWVAPVGDSSVNDIKLEHPMLDDRPCAAVQATRVDPDDAFGTVLDDVAFVLDYRPGVEGAAGHWYIAATGAGSPMFPAHAAFNVTVLGGQSGACATDRIFADGFEG